MRHIFFFLAVCSVSAYACPDLSGEYLVCRNQSNLVVMTDVVLSQLVTDNITTYSMELTDVEGERSSDEYRADSITYTSDFSVPELGIEAKVDTKSSCSENALKINQEIVVNGEVVVKMDSTLSKKDNRLVLTVQGHNEEETVNELITCQ
jgi:hypothetical protein